MSILTDAKDEGLTRKLNEGDEAAFARLFDEFGPTLFRHVYFRVNQKEVAEDLVSQAFLQLWRHISEGKPVAHARKLLYTIAHNLIVDHYRSKSHAPLLMDESAESMIGDLGEAVKLLEHHAEIVIVQKAIANLKEEYRDVLTWRYIDDLDIATIASISGKSKNAISIILHRALKELSFLIRSRKLHL